MTQLADDLTLQEVARALDRSLEQVRRYVREGKLPARKMGMQWFVSRRALDAFQTGRGGATKQDLLSQARALREKIKNRAGLVDVVELLDDSRRSLG